MIQTIIDFVTDQIKTNQFFTGAAAGSITYFVLGYLQKTYYKIYNIIVNYFTRDITISSYNNTKMYSQANLYLSQYVKHPKNISAVDSNQEMRDEYSILSEKDMAPNLSYGPHWFIYNFYTIVYINISVEEHHGNEKSDIMKVNIFSPRARTIRSEIYSQFVKSYVSSLNIPKVYTVGNRFESVASKNLPDRKLSSIFINQIIKQKAIAAIDNLSVNKELYEKNCLNRHLGILLYGPPGTGKSSFITALGNYFKRSIYYIYPDDKNFPYISDIKENSIVVIEDIDCYPMFLSRDEDKSDPKLLAKYLKLFDGEMLPENVIIIITTNHIDKLDGAVKRAGRFDLQLEFEKANEELAKEMVLNIDPTKLHVLDNMEFPCPQAEIQGKVLKLMKEI